MLRAETSRALSPAVGVDDAENLMALLRRHQEDLYDDYDWPHLRQMFPAIPLQAGQRYYDIPDGLNYERLETAAVRLNGMPIPFPQGIDFACYTAFDSDAGVRASPPQRWDIRWVDNKEQIEVWPIPSDNASSMQFVGIRKLRRLIDSDDVCDIDDRLIVLFAAYDLLLHADAADANAKLEAGRQLYARLKGRVSETRPTVRLGMGQPPVQPWRATVVIAGR